MKKIVLSVFTLILALAMLMTPVFAGGDNANLPDETEIQPRAQQCEECNIGSIYYLRTDYSPEYYIGTISYCKSSGGNHHKDNVYEYTVTKVYQCNYCDVQSTVESTKLRYECP